MAFYNRILAQMVARYVDANNQVEPLDVVEYGGASFGTVSVANNSTAQILAAPPAGFSWRLHRWGIVGVASATGGVAELSDGFGHVDTVTVPSVNGDLGFGNALFGALSSTAVSVHQVLTITATFWIRFDAVLTPSID